MTKLPYTLTGPISSRASLGLVVLQFDEVIEQDFRRLFRSPDIALHVSRIPSGTDVTGATLAAMEADLPRAAGLLAPSVDFAAIGYGCTSGATVIHASVTASVTELERNPMRAPWRPAMARLWRF